MSSLPVVPSFVSGEHNLANLQALSWAVSFLTDCDRRPTWTLYRVATQAIPAATWTNIAFNTVALDSDGLGVSDGTGATIVTQGYYHVEASGISINTGTSAGQCHIRFAYTTGPNNPHFTNGTFGFFGDRGSTNNVVAGTDTALSASSGVPITLFPGDQLVVQVWTTLALNLNLNNNLNYLEGRFAPRFTGIWIGEGQ